MNYYLHTSDDHSCFLNNKPIKKFNIHTNCLSPFLCNYFDAFRDPNRLNAFNEENNALILNISMVLVPRPPDANVDIYISNFKKET